MKKQYVKNRLDATTSASSVDRNRTATTDHRFDCAFSLFLDAWREHENLRKASPSVPVLWASRCQLDELRREQRRLRCAC